MKALSVHLGEIQIGLLEHFDDESEVFTFSESYLESHIDSRPVLGQLFEDRIPKQIHVDGPIGCLVATIAYINSNELALELGGSKRFDNLEAASFQIVSDCLGLSLNQLVIRIAEYAGKGIDSWRGEGVKDNFTTLQRDRIEQHVAAVAKQFSALRA